MTELTLERIDSPRGVVHVVARGHLDSHTAPQLDALIEEALAQGATRLVVDLERITYVASAGVGVLIGALSALGERGGRLVLVCPQEVEARDEGETGLADGFNPMEVFHLLGLSESFPVAASREQAEEQALR